MWQPLNLPSGRFNVATLTFTKNWFREVKATFQCELLQDLILFNYTYPCMPALGTIMGYSRKNTNRGGWGYTLLKNSMEFFIFLTLPLEIPDKTKLNHWIFHKIVLDLLEISRPKTKTPGNSTLFFLLTLGNSISFLINPLEIPLAISLMPLEIPYLQPHLFAFFLG